MELLQRWAWSSNSDSFKYNTIVKGNTYNIADGDDAYDGSKVGKNETKILVPLKYLSNFWRTSDIPVK